MVSTATFFFLLLSLAAVSCWYKSSDESEQDNSAEIIESRVYGFLNKPRPLRRYAELYPEYDGNLQAEDFTTRPTGLDVKARNAFFEETQPPMRRVGFRAVSDVPLEKDWRESACINPIKDQGRCGSCYAFAATASLEAIQCIKNGGLKATSNISEQMYTDCSFGGCRGGYAALCFLFTHITGRCDATADYKYTATDGVCPKMPKSVFPVAQVAGIVRVRGTMTSLLEAIANVGPIVISLCVDEAFSRYGSEGSERLFQRRTPFPCQINHEVTVVGYTEDALIIRNSWGPKWGFDGYMYMERDVTARNYGIYTYPGYYPVLY